MKVLVTGGAGFLGSNLSKRAIENNDDLVVFDNLMRIGSESNLDWLKKYGKFKFIHGDIRNYNDVEEIIKKFKPDVIFHTAGQVAMTTSLENPMLDFETNAAGTLNLLECVRKYSKDSTFIYSSTNKVYGDLSALHYEETSSRYKCIEYPNGFPETLPLDLKTPYGISKGAADSYVLEYSRTYMLKAVVLRHSSLYGERQFATVDQGWVGWFIREALSSKSNKNAKVISISGDGKQVRDILYVKDAVDLYFKLANDIDKASGEVFNVGGGNNNSLSILELFDLLEEILDINLEIKKNPARKDDQKVFISDNTKISQKIGWKANTDIEEGLKRMISWVSQF